MLRLTPSTAKRRPAGAIPAAETEKLFRRSRAKRSGSCEEVPFTKLALPAAVTVCPPQYKSTAASTPVAPPAKSAAASPLRHFPWLPSAADESPRRQASPAELSSHSSTDRSCASARPTRCPVNASSHRSASREFPPLSEFHNATHRASARFACVSRGEPHPESPCPPPRFARPDAPRVPAPKSPAPDTACGECCSRKSQGRMNR